VPRQARAENVAPGVETRRKPNVIGQARHVAAPRTGETTMKYLVMIYASEANEAR